MIQEAYSLGQRHFGENYVSLNLSARDIYLSFSEHFLQVSEIEEKGKSPIVIYTKFTHIEIFSKNPIHSRL